MLLERIDELPLASHDLRGNPSALLGSIVARIDRLKDELVTAADYAAWAATLPEETDADRTRAAREREFAAIYAAHDRMLAEAGTLDFGDLVLHAFRLLREKPHVRARLAARYAHVLVDELQDANFAQTLLLRLLAGRARQPHRRGRRRPGDPPLPRRGDQEPRRLPRRLAGRHGRAAGRELPLRRAHPRAPRTRSSRPIEERLEKRLAPGRTRPAATSRSGAARTSARRRRRSRPTSSG